MSESSFALPPVQNGLTLTERVYTIIKEAILDLELKPGSPLVEEELARQLKTSKTPVRDAFLALERDGLVTKIAYKGTYVSEVSLKDAAEIFELRAVLEGLAARLAVQYFSPKELNKAEALLDAADKARMEGDHEAASKYGAAFHKTIHLHANNQRLVPILEKLDEQLRRLRYLSDRVEGRLEKSAREHRNILASLRTGDPAWAEQAMRFHLESVLQDFSITNPVSTDEQPIPPKELAL